MLRSIIWIRQHKIRSQSVLATPALLKYEGQWSVLWRLSTHRRTQWDRDRYSPKKTGHGSCSMAVQNYDVGLNVLGCWADILGTTAVYPQFQQQKIFLRNKNFKEDGYISPDPVAPLLVNCLDLLASIIYFFFLFFFLSYNKIKFLSNFCWYNLDQCTSLCYSSLHER